MTTITEHGETFDVHDKFVFTRDTVRKLSEGFLKCDPNRKVISRVPKDKVRRHVAGYNQRLQRPSFDGMKFTHVSTGQVIEVQSRNIYGKLIIKWPDGTQNQIGDREFELAFSETAK